MPKSDKAMFRVKGGHAKYQYYAFWLLKQKCYKTLPMRLLQRNLFSESKNGNYVMNEASFEIPKEWVSWIIFSNFYKISLLRYRLVNPKFQNIGRVLSHTV